MKTIIFNALSDKHVDKVLVKLSDKEFTMTNKINFSAITFFPDGRLDAKNAAAYLGLSSKTLATMRVNGRGPRFIKRGRIFYFRDDLDAWINADGRFCSTAQARFQTKTINEEKESTSWK